MLDRSEERNCLGDYVHRCTPQRCGNEALPVLSVTKERSIVFQDERFDSVVASENKENYIIVPRGYIVQGIHIDEGNFGLQDLVERGIVSPAYKLWKITSKEVVPKLLEYFLRSERAIAYYRRNFQGTTVARRQTIRQEDLLKMPLNFPRMDRQISFYEFMQQSDKSKYTLGEQICLTKTLLSR